jgi:death-on-curing protein
VTRAWRWLGENLILAIHDEQLAEHGGASGLRDIGLLQSALARPRHLAAYADPDVFELAAGYAFGIARDHPFIDGNKRTAFVAAAVFLVDHGHDIVAPETAALETMLRLADGQVSAEEFAAWLRQNCRPAQEPG